MIKVGDKVRIKASDSYYPGCIGVVVKDDENRGGNGACLLDLKIRGKVIYYNKEGKDDIDGTCRWYPVDLIEELSEESVKEKELLSNEQLAEELVMMFLDTTFSNPFLLKREVQKLLDHERN